MKLLHKTIQYQLLATLLIMLLTGCILYVRLKSEITSEMDEQLELETELVVEELKAGRSVNHPSIIVEKLKTVQPAEKRTGDTLIYDFVQKMDEGYHYLETVRPVGSEQYRIRVMTTYIGWDHYLKNIIGFFILMAVLIGGSWLLLTYFFNKKLWKSFFYNLTQVKKYSVSSDEPIELMNSEINEFADLKLTLQELADSSRREYKALREFTENASHEIQTPISIVRSKLDRISQLEISEEIAKYIVEARSGVDRLSKMNKSLLLLAKLDNNAFEVKQDVQLDAALNQFLIEMEELFTGKNIAVEAVIQPVRVSANRQLCDILLTNLLSNAFRYTESGGGISIALTEAALVIANSGAPLDFDKDVLFERFTKGGANFNSTGLGLSIVKQVCLLNDWQIVYSYEQGRHVFTVSFSTIKIR